MTHKAQKWRTVSSRQLLDTSGFKVYEDVVRLPNGEETRYIHTPSSANSIIIIAVNDKQQLLLQREYNYPPDIIMWQLPGGSMLPGETVEAAALRELSEESGYAAHHSKVLHFFYTSNRISDKKQFVVLCTDLYPRKLEEDADEFIDSYWVAQSEVHHMIENGEFSNINLLAALNTWFHFKA